jgi:hypothetical protein
LHRHPWVTHYPSVASSSAIWAEWIACGPLLVFITVALDHKTQLSRTDWVLMMSFGICVLAGFMVIIPAPYGVGNYSTTSKIHYFFQFYRRLYFDDNKQGCFGLEFPL